MRFMHKVRNFIAIIRMKAIQKRRQRHAGGSVRRFKAEQVSGFAGEGYGLGCEIGFPGTDISRRIKSRLQRCFHGGAPEPSDLRLASLGLRHAKSEVASSFHIRD
ncbi:hypothetical protein MPAR168_00255 [Methylorubrum populi]|uniref:Uncharacterized protein n=1 Tax=Methylobacterium radiotolerans TaxID=31998 RepID=A0ABU7T417_9HYPH